MDKEFISLMRNRIALMKNRNDYEIIEDILFPKSKKCKCCGKSIYYYNSTFRFDKKGKFIKANKSGESKWTINGLDFLLSFCENCITEKFPEYKTYNRSRVFNTLNRMTIFAYQIPEEIADYHKKSSAVTLDHMIKKHGEEIGKQKFEEYRKKCADTNKIEYKKVRHGWTDEEFKNFNLSRAVTLDNMIKRYGEEIGTQKFEEYRKKQSVNGSKLEWFIGKYGEELGQQKYKDVNNQKKNTQATFIDRHGEELGQQKFEEFMVNRASSANYSKNSQILFKKLDAYLTRTYNFTTYFGSKNKEFGKNLKNYGYVYLDFYIKELNLCIEFNGDIWHANPKRFSENDKPNFFNKQLTAREIWEKDDLRYQLLKEQHNIDTIVVWESDKTTINELVKSIEYYINKEDKE